MEHNLLQCGSQSQPISDDDSAVGTQPLHAHSHDQTLANFPASDLALRQARPCIPSVFAPVQFSEVNTEQSDVANYLRASSN